MSEMVRIVARAICQSRTCEGASCCQWPANRGRTKCPVAVGGYDDAAVAALNSLKRLPEFSRFAQIEAFDKRHKEIAALMQTATEPAQFAAGIEAYRTMCSAILPVMIEAALAEPPYAPLAHVQV